ncbi:phage tail tape measure protein [Curtobacterium flaccumfaciens]|uniref:phage tail tape measure protein n=1 Tax=Curtobacterium flaccumfaciens TaxID=2035 RepID=UPI0013E913F0|nr:phage tail tape measure protein [Curtobacterium flaccumfaciens]MCS0644976.1 phage tail tape measure protein [Curtobacterium flaccumfaciens pv. flaccumfaciens]MCS6526736.1 phage tail tape measure protein [Curtobacterium flaccumfaciens pv. flaccumfaciens]NUU12121.1 phage tail tape measure protein [Curtobacterium flaccumfaciens]
MAERVVQVTIRAAIDNYVKGMEKVRKATADTAKESDKLEKVGQAAERVGGSLLTMGAAATGSVLIVTKMAADFDAQMSKVQAATNASASEMDKFRNQALTAGAAFGYTATQVTEAQVELGKAGLATRDILGGGLTGVLALAASDNVDLGKATQIAAVAMKQFNLEGSDVPHIADLLAAGAGKALGGVQELGDALNQSGLVASNFGFSIEETTGVLSSFADAGLLGSDAGTSLKSMLQMLANPSKESAQLMKSLGINVEDANGQFLGAADIAQVLQERLSGLTDAQRQQALSQIFGADAVRAATVLYKEGADGIQEYIDQNNDAGYAIEQAAKKSNNLNGDLSKLKSAFQAGLIESGTSASSALRPMVQDLTSFIQKVRELPEPLKATALGATGVVGAATLLGGGLLLAVPKIVEFRSAMASLRASGITGRAALSSMSGFLGGPWVGGVALGVTAVALLNTELEKLKADSSEITHTLKSASSAAEIYKTLGKGQLSAGIDGSVKDQLKDMDAALQSFASHNSANGFQAILTRFTNTDFNQGVNALRDINAEMGQLANTDPSKAVRAFELLAEQTDGSQKSLHRLVDAIGGDYRSALVQQADALGITANDTNLVKLAMGQYADAAKGAKQPTQDNADALNALQGAAGEAAPSIDEVANALRALTSPTLDAREAKRQFQAAVDGVTDSLKENGTTLDISTEKGRNNQSALDGIAQAAQNAAGSIFQQTGNQQSATAAMEQGRSELVKALGQYGITGQAAQDYANKIIGTPTDWATTFQNNAPEAASKTSDYQQRLNALPKEKRTQVNAATAQAQSAIQGVLNSLGLVQSKTITITTNRVTVGTPENTNGVFKNKKANGGYISGPGTGTSDSIPAMLSNGEYVIRERSVSKYGTGFLDAVNAGRYANGGLVHLAGGGSAEAAQKAAEARAKAAKERAEARQKAEAARLSRLSDIYGFRTGVRTGSLTGQSAVSQAFQIATDSKYPERFRLSVARVAGASEKRLLSLEKQSDKAAKAVDRASDKLDGLKSSASSMSSSISGKLSDFSYGDYRSSSSLQRALTGRASKLKEFQSLLTKLQKNGVAPALLNEIASLGIDEGIPLARSLATSSKAQIAAINTQYKSIQSTSAQIGNQVADANFGKLIDAAEKQLRSANRNATSITRAIASESRKLQRVIGKALGVPGYSVGGYTGDYGTGQVAGLVHGREFVVNASATAANRPLLEAMNQGGSVRYMDSSRVVQAAPKSSTSVEQHNHFKPMPNLDPNTLTTVLGRQLTRELAGMVN